MKFGCGVHFKLHRVGNAPHTHTHISHYIIAFDASDNSQSFILPNSLVWRRYYLLHIHSGRSFFSSGCFLEARISLTNKNVQSYIYESKCQSEFQKPVTYISIHLENIYHEYFCLQCVLLINDSRYDRRIRCVELSNHTNNSKEKYENKSTLNIKHCMYVHVQLYILHQRHVLIEMLFYEIENKRQRSEREKWING